MKFKFTVIVLIFLSLIFSANATLYHSGETVKVAFNVYSDEGTDDDGATLTDSYCLDPNDNYAGKKTFTASEEDETNMPGVWSGTYLIPATPLTGVWRCVARFTNSNGSVGSAIKSFKVSDVLVTQINITALETHGDSTWSTATGFSTHSAADVWTESGRELSTPADYKADVSGLATSASLQDLAEGIDGNRSALETYGDAGWATATGFVTSLQDLSEGIDANSTSINSTISPTEIYNKFIAGANEDEFKADVSSLVTASDLQTLSAGISGNSTEANATRQLIITNIAAISALTSADINISLEYYDSISNQTRELIISHGDSDWATATGFVTSLQDLSEGITGNATEANATRQQIIAHGDSTWGPGAINLQDLSEGITQNATATNSTISPTEIYNKFTAGVNEDEFKADVSGLATSASLQDLSEGIDSNRSALETYGDAGWATATGFVTSLQDLSKGITENITTLNSTAGATYDYLHSRDEWATQTNITNDIPFPPSTAVLTIDLSKSGLINFSALDGREPQHFSGEVDPENVVEMKDTEFAKTYVSIAGVPSNMTNAYIRYWLQKVGAPTGSLAIYLDGNLIHNVTDVSELSTSISFNESRFEPVGNITDTLLEIKFVGNDAWTNANQVQIGAGHIPAAASYGSVDGSTWTELEFEVSAGLVIEFNQKSFAEQVGVQSLSQGITENSTEANLTRTQIISDLSTRPISSDIQTLSEGIDSNRSTLFTVINESLQAIQNYVDVLPVTSDWALATSLQDLAEGITSNTTAANLTREAIITIGNANWLTATGFVTSLQDLSEGIDSNRSALETYGDAGWATATGFVTSLQDLSEGIDANSTSINSTISPLEVYTYFIAGVNEDEFKADVSALVTASDLQTLSAGISGNSTEANATRQLIITNIAAISALTSADINISLEYYDDRANETRQVIISHGDATWGIAGGVDSSDLNISLADYTSGGSW